jgi:hypothetical protein
MYRHIRKSCKVVKAEAIAAKEAAATPSITQQLEESKSHLAELSAQVAHMTLTLFMDLVREQATQLFDLKVSPLTTNSTAKERPSSAAIVIPIAPQIQIVSWSDIDRRIVISPADLQSAFVENPRLVECSRFDEETKADIDGAAPYVLDALMELTRRAHTAPTAQNVYWTPKKPSQAMVWNVDTWVAIPLVDATRMIFDSIVRYIHRISASPPQWSQVSRRAQSAIRWVLDLYGSSPEAFVTASKILMRAHLADLAPLPPDQQLLRAFAAARNASLLSKEIAPNQRLQWKCQMGHTFHLKYEDARDEGLWCDKCPTVGSAGEARCRRIFETLLGVPFPQIRPAFLIREATGQPLELDGYNEELKLAFEYQGVQHYQFSQKWHGSLEELQRQRDRDAEKVVMCQQHGVALLVIPHFITQPGAHIRARLTEMGYLGHQPTVQ